MNIAKSENGANDERAGKNVKKNEAEKERRSGERYHIARMSRLFRVPVSRQPWSKKDVLSLGKIIFLIDGSEYSLTKSVPVALFLLYGPAAFPRGFVEVFPIAPRL